MNPAQRFWVAGAVGGSETVPESFIEKG